jgi:hypothetical protein
LTEPSEVIAIRPTRSADGAVGVTVDTASVLSLELCPRVGRRSDLPRRNVGIAGGRRKCPLAIIAMSPLHRRRIRPAHIGSAGRSGSRRLGDSQRRVCQVAGGPPLVPRFTPADNFALHRRVEQDPARGRLRFRSHSDDRAEAEAATVAVQMSIPWTYFSFSCWARSFSTKGHRNTRTPTPATRAAASVSST